MGVDHECETSCETDNQMEFGNGAFCVSENPVSVDPRAAVVERAIDPYCGFTQEAGNKCSVLIKDGDRLCDKGCTKLVSLCFGIICLPKIC